MHNWEWRLERTGRSFVQLRQEIIGYPFALLNAAALALSPDDELVLEADDGSYSEALRYGDASHEGGCAVFHFPVPDSGDRFSLKIVPQPITISTPEGETSYRPPEHYLFQDQALSLRDGEPADDAPASRLR